MVAFLRLHRLSWRNLLVGERFRSRGVPEWPARPGRGTRPVHQFIPGPGGAGRPQRRQVRLPGRQRTAGLGSPSPRAQLNFVGGPETVFRQIEELHRRSGVGVVDLAFQQPAMSHEGVMEQLELFGRRVLPRVKELGEE